MDEGECQAWGAGKAVGLRRLSRRTVSPIIVCASDKATIRADKIVGRRWRLVLARFASRECGQAFFDAGGAGFGALCLLNPVDVFLFVRVRKGGEDLVLYGSFGQRSLQIGRDRYGARRGVWLHDNGDGVPDAGFGPLLHCLVEGHIEDALAAGHERAAEGESVDGAANGDARSGAEGFLDVEGDVHVGPRTFWPAADEFHGEGLLHGVSGLALADSFDWGGLIQAVSQKMLQCRIFPDSTSASQAAATVQFLSRIRSFTRHLPPAPPNSATSDPFA